MLNLIIPYRHEREGYFKGLCILSGCTDSELTGHLGGCLAAAAALKAGLPNGNRITLHQCAPELNGDGGAGAGRAGARDGQERRPQAQPGPSSPALTPASFDLVPVLACTVSVSLSCKR